VDDGDAVPEPVCEHLLDACSAFRFSLAEDLDTRRRRSVWWALERRRLHPKAEADGG
jgi:hypothetical protein